MKIQRIRIIASVVFFVIYAAAIFGLPLAFYFFGWLGLGLVAAGVGGLVGFHVRLSGDADVSNAIVIHAFALALFPLAFYFFGWLGLGLVGAGFSVLFDFYGTVILTVYYLAFYFFGWLGLALAFAGWCAVFVGLHRWLHQ